MGLFDYIRCKYPLPIDGFQDKEYQTKDTPSQYLDLYEIQENGELRHETYDIEDQSDPAAEGLAAIRGCMTRVNKQWEISNYSGALRFYTFRNEINHTGWIEFEALYDKGKLLRIDLITNKDE